MKTYLLLILLISLIVVGANNVTRLRGTMVNPVLNEQDFRVLASWNVNHIRWPLVWGGFPHGPADKGDIPAYMAWIETALEHLESLFPFCERKGYTVVKKCLKFVCLSVLSNQKRAFLFFIFSVF